METITREDSLKLQISSDVQKSDDSSRPLSQSETTAAANLMLRRPSKRRDTTSDTYFSMLMNLQKVFKVSQSFISEYLVRIWKTPVKLENQGPRLTLSHGLLFNHSRMPICIEVSSNNTQNRLSISNK